MIMLLLAGAWGAARSDSAERIRLVAADRVESATEGGAVVRKLVGNVRLVQGAAYMDCDEAILFGSEERARLVSRVVIHDGKRTLRADEVGYDGRRRIETASGHASIISGTKTIAADRIEYRQESEEVTARGRVALRDTVERLLLESDSAFYDRKLDYAMVSGRPRAVKFDTSGSKKDWRIRGRRMETWGPEKKMLITDSASIAQEDMEATGRTAEYRSGENLLILRSSPKVVQLRREITGDSMAIRVRDMKFQGGRIFGKARIVSTDSAGRDELKGGRITIEARGDTLDKVTVEEQAESAMRVDGKNGEESGVNTATGDRIVLIFEEDKLKRVEVTSRPGTSTGKFVPDESSKP
jgi:lipopolysaccharide export system protein LptA